MAIDYKSAGVDVEAGYEAVRRMKKHAESTYDSRVLGGLGSFGGLYSIAGMNMEEPVLVAGTDGVGTKLKLAFALNRHNSIGIDCVAMCVNDIVCQGATPLLFLDYIATGHLEPAQAEQIVSGIADGCRQAGCALIGGETAEMPGFYPVGEYDVAGFSVGIVDRKNVIDGSRIEAGDALIGFASSGVHSNGFSLVRRLVGEDFESLSKTVPGINGTLGDALLMPTRIYVKPALALIKEFDIHGVSHITGGGFIENIPRMLPDGMDACIDRSAWPVSPLFSYLTDLAGLSVTSAFNTFNMGIGMVFALPKAQAQAACARAKELGEQAYIIGEVVSGGSKAVRL